MYKVFLYVTLLLSVACTSKKENPKTSTTSSKKQFSLATKIKLGKHIYNSSCAKCHLINGKGLEGSIPPLANSDYLNADVKRAIGIVINGKSDSIKVNGVWYKSLMNKQTLNNDEISYVLSYIYNNWDNSKKDVSAKLVQQVRDSLNGKN